MIGMHASGRHVLRLLVLICCCLKSFDALSCSDEHVRELSASGKSVSRIAKLCDIDKDEVVRILSEGDADDGGEDDGEDSREGTVGHRGRLPRGARIVACGCWGYVAPGAGQPNRDCASGYEAAVPCGGMCPGGGSAWARVCQ